MKLFDKILIANRGEIAVRIIRTARRLGIKTVAIYAEDDIQSLHVSMADKAFLLEGKTLAETYLNQKAILELAKENGVQAIHPGYGFLSENAEFAKLVEDQGLVFIGATPNQITLMGEKTQAIDFAKKMNVPIVPGIQGTAKDILSNIPILSFPVLVKASAGGGGKGMQVVDSASELPKALNIAQRQTAEYFGNGDIFVEKYVANTRHIEVQVFGDGKGNAIHLFERECSIQRRYQKLIEESPAVSVSSELKTKLYDTAVRITKSIQYRGAGTIEFLVDENENFYFLEMNTRLQVEHPVTEMTTGLDLVEWQLQIAAGNGLPKEQSEITQKGHSIELRLCAEDPLTDFQPSAGKIEKFEIPQEVNFRFDSFLKEGIETSPNYDSLLGKLIVFEEDRNAAIQKMISVSENVMIPGLKTNLSFLRQILGNESFQQNTIDTRFAETRLTQLKATLITGKNKVPKPVLLIAYSLFHFWSNDVNGSAWQRMGYNRNTNEFFIELDGEKIQLCFWKNTPDIKFKIDESVYSASGINIERSKISFSLDNSEYTVLLFEKDGFTWAQVYGFQFKLRSNHILTEAFVNKQEVEEITVHETNVLADLFGKVIKTLVRRGDKVLRNQVLLVIESMKTEFRILSPIEGVIKQLHVDIGSVVQDKQLLIEFETQNKIKVSV